MPWQISISNSTTQAASLCCFTYITYVYEHIPPFSLCFLWLIYFSLYSSYFLILLPESFDLRNRKGETFSYFSSLWKFVISMQRSISVKEKPSIVHVSWLLFQWKQNFALATCCDSVNIVSYSSYPHSSKPD